MNHKRKNTFNIVLTLYQNYIKSTIIKRVKMQNGRKYLKKDSYPEYVKNSYKSVFGKTETLLKMGKNFEHSLHKR